MMCHAINEGEYSQRNYQTSSIKEAKRHCEIHSEYILLHNRIHNSLTLKAYDRKRMDWFKEKLSDLWKNIDRGVERNAVNANFGLGYPHNTSCWALENMPGE